MLILCYDGSRTVLTCGEAVNHLGVHGRFTHPGSRTREIASATLKPGVTEGEYRDVLGAVRGAGNQAIRLAAQWGDGGIWRKELQRIAEVLPSHGGGIKRECASVVHPMVSIGTNIATAGHVDGDDCTKAIWVGVGGRYYLALQEYHLFLEVNAGDVVTFFANDVLHSLAAHPDPPQDWPEHYCLSFYTNRKQVAEIKKDAVSDINEYSRVKALGGIHELPPYEKQRLYRIRANHQRIKELLQQHQILITDPGDWGPARDTEIWGGSSLKVSH